MKKLILMCAVIGMALYFPSCGGCGSMSADMSNPESISKTAVSLAEEAVPSVESPVPGTLPSIAIQRMTVHPVTNGLTDGAGGEIKLTISCYAHELADMTAVKFIQRN